MKTKRLVRLFSIIAVISVSLVLFQACSEEQDHDHDHDHEHNDHDHDHDHDHETVKTGIFTSLELEVEGMTCTGCEEHITTAIMELDGINHAKLSHTEGNAIIEFDKSKTDRSKIVDAIKDSGYKVVE